MSTYCRKKEPFMNTFMVAEILQKDMWYQNIFLFNQNKFIFNEIDLSLNKKWSFPLRISSLTVTKSTDSFGFGHIYWRNL